MIPGVNNVIYGCSPARTFPGVSLYRSLTLEENIVTVITHNRMIDDNLKRQIKNRTMCTFRLFLLTSKYFNILAIGQIILAFTHSLCSIYIARV